MYDPSYFGQIINILQILKWFRFFWLFLMLFLVCFLSVLSMFWSHRLKEDGSGSAYDKESMAIIKLNNTTVLYLKEVTKFLALVCILREESFERKGISQQ